MIKCIVIDDEPLALQQLQQYVAQTSVLELEGAFDTASSALAFLRDVTIDLIFVDINMPQISGLDFVAALPYNVKVVFVTAYREYALEGFALDAADYLLKPLSYAAFLKSVEKVHKRYFTSCALDGSDRDYIFVRSDYRSVRVNFNTILYIESKREYLDIVLSDGQVVTTHGTLSSICERLPQKKFVRVHRSFAVNLDKISVVERGAIVFGKQFIPVSEQAKEVIGELINRV